jgi:hypothetical protein
LASSLAQGYADSIDPATLVKLTGDQTIAGLKTFSTNPRSSATQGTNATDLTRKDYVDAQRDTRVAKSGDTVTGTLTVNGTINGTAVTQSATDATIGKLLKVGDFGVGTAPTYTGDLNSLTSSGSYRLYNATLYQNAPSWFISSVGVAFVNVISQGSSYLVQTAYLSRHSENPRVSIRFLGGGVWTPWQEIYHTGLSDISRTGAQTVGTQDASNFTVKTNNTRRIIVRPTGQVTIGSSTAGSTQPFLQLGESNASAGLLLAAGYSGEQVLGTINKNYSSMGLGIGYGVKTFHAAGYGTGKFKSTCNVNLGRGYLDAVHHLRYYNAPASITPIDDDVDLQLVFEVNANKVSHGVNGVLRDMYSQHNILGTVSQTAGVPTGAIIERGSNANGEYVKYADGTLICWLRNTSVSLTNEAAYTLQGITFYRNLLTWTFPSTFSTTAGLSVISSVRQNIANTSVSAFSVSPSTSSVDLNNVSVYSWSSYGRVGVTAIATGRWY